MKVFLQGAPLAGLLAVIAGCGGADPSDPSATEDVGTQTQAFNESTCGTTAADVTLNSANGWAATSPDASYTHSTCTHAFIGAANSDSSHMARAYYSGPIVPPSWGCNGMWVTLSLWKKVSGTTYSHVSDSTSYGAGFGTSCLAPVANINLPASNDYKLVSQAGYATSYQQVSIGISLIPQ